MSDSPAQIRFNLRMHEGARQHGPPLRYPGVICSREGQELYVPSFAPLMVTDPL